MPELKSKKRTARGEEHKHLPNSDIIQTNKNGEIAQNEQARPIFTVAIIAGFLAYIQIGHTVSSYIGIHPSRAIGLTLGLSAVFSFLYLMTVAAALKHTQSGYIDGFELNIMQKIAFYDLSVDVLAIAPVAALISMTQGFSWLKYVISAIILALALALVFLVFPMLWTRYEVQSTCPACAAAINGKKKLKRWDRIKPKLIKQLLSSIIFLAIITLANKIL